ncbi:MAG TPA: ChrR family anti-sigma-E factor [Azospirillaceae bacterium]|nr:ChrR family anti-sigma-E factor [Azospirillaceae bacterium]
MNAARDHHHPARRVGLPLHHPTEALLVDYASGALGEAAALVVATHLALCPQCRAEVNRLEALGGSLMLELDPAPVGPATLEAVLARLDTGASEPSPAPVRPMAAGAMPMLPEPLRSYAGGDPHQIAWRRVMPGLEEAAISCGAGKARLLRVRAGATLPRHTHDGNEYTLVLDGSFGDDCGRFGRGDFAATDPSVEHTPTADPRDGCLCLAVTDAPLRLTGPVGRFLNPFLKL